MSNTRQNGWTADQTQMFCGTSLDPREGLHEFSKFQKSVSKNFWFFKNFENARKNIIKSANVLLLLMFYILQREDAYRKPQLKVEIEAKSLIFIYCSVHDDIKNSFAM